MTEMELNDIKPAAGAKQPRRRVGRGIGSGLGKTAGRGHKGQKCARRRLPQGRLRRRPDAAAAPPAQARLQLADARATRPKCAWPTCASVEGDGDRPAALKQAGLVPRDALSARRSSCRASSSARSCAQGHRRHQGRARRRSRRPAARVEIAGRRSPRASCTKKPAADSRRSAAAWRPIPHRQASASYGDLQAPAVLPAGRARRLPHRRAHPGAGHRPERARASCSSSQQGGILEHVQHVLGRRAVALHDLRAGHHAVHLGVDHHAADDGRVAAARGAEEGRRVGPPQDHAVHALRHAGPRAVPGARHRDRARSRSRAW